MRRQHLGKDNAQKLVAVRPDLHRRSLGFGPDQRQPQTNTMRFAQLAPTLRADGEHPVDMCRNR